jgi:DNA-binding CsgD family transcriptional regulator
MPLTLSAADMRRFSAASEALLTPATDPDPAAWWSGVEPRMRELFPGANFLFLAADGPRMRYASESVSGGAMRRVAELTALDERAGTLVVRCPMAETWLAYRRAHRIEAFDEASIAQVLGPRRLDFGRSVWRNDGLLASGLHDWRTVASTNGDGELYVTLGYDAPGRSRLGSDDLTLLSALRPALRAGHHALLASSLHRAALGATIDAVAEALLVVGPHGRELHRNAALRRLLAADPERDRVVAALCAAARVLTGVAARNAAPTNGVRRARTEPAAALAAAGAVARTVVTSVQRYAVRATYLPTDLLGEAGGALVSLERAGATADVPDQAAVAARFGLTAREVDVVRALAQRLTNDEVARALGISRHTARRHTERVMEKLGVHSRTEVAATVWGGMT